MTQTVEVLQKEVEQLATQLEAKIHLESELSAVQEQLDEQKRSCIAKDEENQNLRSLLAHHTDHMESLNSTLQDLEARNSILETSMEKAPTEDHICTGELEQKLKASEEQLQLQECTVTTFKSDVVAKLKGLKLKWKDCVDERNKECEVLENEKSDLQASNVKLGEDLEAKEKEIEASKQVAGNLEADLEVKDKEIEASKEVAGKLEEDLLVKDKEISNLKLDVGVHETKSSELAKQLVEEKKSYDNLIESLKLEHEANKSDLVSNHSKLESQVDGLEEQLKEMSEHKAAADDLHEQLANKSKTLEEKAELNAKLEKMNNSLTKDFKEVQASLAKLENDQGSYLTTSKQIQSDKEDLSKQVSGLESENKKLKNRIKDVENNNTNVKRKLENCQRSLDEKAEEKKHQSKKNQSLMKDLKSYKRKYEENKEKVKSLEGPVEAMREENEKEMSRMRSAHKKELKKMKTSNKKNVDQAKSKSMVVVKGWTTKAMMMVMGMELFILYFLYSFVTAMN